MEGIFLLSRWVMLFGSILFSWFEIFFACAWLDIYLGISAIFLLSVCCLEAKLTIDHSTGRMYEDSELRVVLNFGYAVLTLTLALSIFLLACGVTHQEPHFGSSGFFRASVAMIVACCWSVMLVYDSKKYRILFAESAKTANTMSMAVSAV